MEFRCPNCNAILTKDTEEADRILGLVKAKGVLAGVMP
jgi:transcription initiation factor IIE alpha subunit